ncbi:MAG: hypothetical protein MZV64_23580 [Ignavibacteriales bacterium]|nr:hypothetical protein [Ignavibacteriales bacterium]
MLAHQSQGVSVVTAPHAETDRLQTRGIDLHAGTAGLDGAGDGRRRGQPADPDSG